MRGWIVLHCFGDYDILPRWYKTEKNANKFAEEHRKYSSSRCKCEAVVVNVADLVEWINLGKDELERMFRL